MFVHNTSFARYLQEIPVWDNPLCTAWDYILHAASDHRGNIWAWAMTSRALGARTPSPGIHDIAGGKMWGRLVCYDASVSLIMSRVSRLCNPIIWIHILFGMGRNAMGITPKPCARHAVFLKLPGDWYTGWYSWLAYDLWRCHGKIKSMS